MRRSFTRLAAQAAMFVFIIVLAWNLHPYLIRYDNNLVWILSFLVILGLLMLPGWLFDRQQKPTGKPLRSKIVRVHKSLPLPAGGQLFVSSNGIGPMDGFKGFRTTAVYQSSPPIPRRPTSTGHVIRWMLVLPAAALAYVLVVIACIGILNDQTVNTWGVLQFTLMFALATTASVLVGASVAPTRHVPVACALVVLLTGTFVYFTARVAPSGIRDTSLLVTVVGQLAAGFLTTLLVWWNARRSKGQRQTRRTFE